jgi:hypothetical protein
MGERFTNADETASTFNVDLSLPNETENAESELREKASTLLKDVFRLDEAEEAKLVSRIEANKGLIRVIIHPFYFTKTGPRWASVQTPQNAERVGAVETGTRRIIEKSSAQTPPVFIVEERKGIDDTLNRLAAEIERSQTPVYVIPSKSDQSTPDVSAWGGTPWETLEDRLGELGVQRILVGGMYLWLPGQHIEPWSKAEIQRLDPGGCVGSFMRNVGSKFEIEVSALSNPGSRRDFLARNGSGTLKGF